MSATKETATKPNWPSAVGTATAISARVAHARAPHRHHGLHQREGERENERVVAELGDHRVFPSVVALRAAALGADALGATAPFFW